MRIKIITTALLSILLCINITAQQKLTKEEILNMSIGELSELPLEDLMQAVETLGVSSVDELFALIMNKNVSSASKTEEDSFTSPLSTTVITKDEMRTYGILSIEEAFRLIPGMIVAEKNPGNFDIQVRGLNNIPDNNMLLYTENANTLLMIDGRPMHAYSIAALTTDFLPISIEDVERIEVVRGACGALYGANAVTGVINIITHKPNSESSIVSGNFQMGNNSTMIGDLGLHKAWKDGKIATGLTFNIQARGRSTDLLPTTPTADERYYVIDDDLLNSTRNSSITDEQIQQWLQEGKIRLSQGEEWLSTEEMERFRTVKAGTIFNTTEPITKISEQFDDLHFSRKNVGVNGYISIVPSADVRFDITGGYVKSSALISDVQEDVYPYSSRIGNKAYVNLQGHVSDLQVNIGYCTGSQDYVKGFPGFKVFERTLTGSAEYNIKAGDLNVKPGISYEWIKLENYVPVFNDPSHSATDIYEAYSWHYEKPGSTVPDYKGRLYGFFDMSTHIYSVGPSLRLDYKVGNFRVIGAFRSDKTRMPDKWNPSWQLAANYSINDNNFIRFVYGRANRSGCLINTTAKYQWLRTNMLPARIVFQGNGDADLVHIDNIELGYRWRPTQNILLDAEVFYSLSEDYGALMSDKSMFAISTDDLAQALISGVAMQDKLTPEQIGGGLVYPKMETRAYLKYNNLPFKVKQMGISLNMDYIISSKLIAKLNINAQQTTIDNYYMYNRNASLATQLGAATQALYKGILSGAAVKAFLDDVNKVAEEQKIEPTEAAAIVLQTQEYMSKYANTYDIQKSGSDYFFGSSVFTEPERENGYKHKATPAVYGMLGLIYKPTTKLSISGFANFIGKRTFRVTYGEKELDNRFTLNLKIGYRPTPQMEVFANAHNLFNTEAQEFVYADKIGGTYTFGVNFNF